MAQQPPISGTKKRGPGLNKAVMIDTVRGQGRIRKWPKGRTIAKGTAQRARNDKFRVASQFMKYLTAREWFVITEAVKGTPLMPRDVMMMLLYLRIYQIQNSIEGTIYSMAERQDVSDSLDVLGSTPGFTLIRGAEFWEAAPSSGGGSGMLFNWHENQRPSRFQLYNGAFQGCEYDVAQTIQITDCACYADYIDTGTYQMMIAEVSSGSVIQALTMSDELVMTATTTDMFYFKISTTMTAGKRYAIMIGRTDAGATYSVPVCWFVEPFFNLPMKPIRRVWLASIAPAVSDTLTQVSASIRSPFFGIGAAI